MHSANPGQKPRGNKVGDVLIENRKPGDRVKTPYYKRVSEPLLFGFR